MMTIAWILLIILGIVAVIDLKFRSIPSTFLTGIILMTAVVHFYPFEEGLISLAFGTLAFIYSRMLYEADFIGGVADIKVITIIGLMISNLQMFLALMLMVVLFGMAYKLTFRFVLKKEHKEEIPFIPCLYAVYVAMFFIGGVA